MLSSLFEFLQAIGFKKVSNFKFQDPNKSQITKSQVPSFCIYYLVPGIWVLLFGSCDLVLVISRLQSY
jgi:hypothetical protein